MLALLHFLVLLAVPLAAGRSLRASYGAPTPARVVAAGGFGGACALVGLSQMQLCDEGFPLAQWIIPGAAASASMLFVAHRPARRAVAIGSVLAALALSFSFTEAVHGPRYTGNARSGGARAAWHTFLTGLYDRASAR